MPAGVVINAYGNTLYDTPDRVLGLILFFVGFALALYGRRPWLGATEQWRIRRWLETKKRTPEWVRFWGDTKTVAWVLVAVFVFLYPLFLFERIAAAPDRLLDHGRDAGLMIWGWALFPRFTRWLEPKDNLLDRFQWRSLRAMITRTLANFNGASGLAVLLYVELARLPHSNVKVLPALIVTIGIATVVATHKMWNRYRKLCTQAHGNIQTLIRAIERRPGETGEDPLAILDAWDSVERDLRTRADTGYAFGVRFAAKAVIVAMGEAVEKVSNELPGHQEACVQALADLKHIRSICADRIDSVA